MGDAVNELNADFQREASEARRLHVEMLAKLHGHRQTALTEERQAQKYADAVKAYMGLEGLDELTDDERGYRAYFEERRNTKYDLRSMAETRPELVLWAAVQGHLSGNARSLRDARRHSPCLELDDIEGFAIPEVTTALKVDAR